MIAVFHIGIAQSLFAALILFTKKSKFLPDQILGAWMIMIALELLHMLFDIQDNPLFHYTSNFSFISLTFGPFLFLYASKLLQKNPMFTWKDASHFYAYIILSLIHLVLFTNQPMELINPNEDRSFFHLSFIRVLFLLFSLVIYSTAVILIIIKHQKELRQSYSFESSRITLDWLQHITLIFVLTYFILSVLFIFNLIKGNFFDTSHYIPAIGLTIISFSVSYYGFHQPSLFMGEKFPANNNVTANKYLDNKDLQLLKNKIYTFMDEEKPYLDPELTIQQLSDLLKMPRQQVSTVINQNMKKNFFTLINQFRLEEAMRILSNPDYESHSVLSVGHDSGFNSKSSFNALFKHHTGMTPSEYRSKNQFGTLLK